MIICSVIGMIYFTICMVRTFILITTSVFPVWVIIVWFVVSLIVLCITPFIAIPIEDKKILNEKSSTFTITFDNGIKELLKEWLEK